MRAEKRSAAGPCEYKTDNADGCSMELLGPLRQLSYPWHPAGLGRTNPGIWSRLMTSPVQTYNAELRFLPMKEIAPTMPVSDMDAAKQFYVSKLGFNVIFDRAPAFFLIQREHVKIGLQRASGSKPGTGNCYIWTENIRELYAELRAKGLTFVDDIGLRSEYDLTDFVLHDPDGNQIGIGGK